MARKLVVVLPELEDALREKIEKQASGSGFEVAFFETAEDAVPAVRSAEILLAGNAGLCREAPRLKWMCAAQAGIDSYLIPGVFASPDVLLTNSSGAYGVTIAEHAVMVALEMMRKENEYREIVAEHRWKRDLKIQSLYGSRITMLGTGDIGRKTAVRMRAFEPLRITGINRSGQPVPEFDEILTVSEIEEVLPETDLLFMSLPGTAETFHVMDEKRLLLLPKTAYLINVGRGNAIDTAALEACLRQGHLSGAALDVFETEPLPAEDSLWSCPRLHISPHCSGNMTLSHTVRFIVEQFLRDFEHYCKGEPLDAMVDRELGY